MNPNFCKLLKQVKRSHVPQVTQLVASKRALKKLNKRVGCNNSCSNKTHNKISECVLNLLGPSVLNISANQYINKEKLPKYYTLRLEQVIRMKSSLAKSPQKSYRNPTLPTLKFNGFLRPKKNTINLNVTQTRQYRSYQMHINAKRTPKRLHELYKLSEKYKISSFPSNPYNDLQPSVVPWKSNMAYERLIMENKILRNKFTNLKSKYNSVNKSELCHSNTYRPFSHYYELMAANEKTV